MLPRSTTAGSTTTLSRWPHGDLKGRIVLIFTALIVSMSCSRYFTCLNCAVVGSPQHRLAPVAPENGLSAAVAQSAVDLQLIEGADGWKVEAEAPRADEGSLRRITQVSNDVVVKHRMLVKSERRLFSGLHPTLCYWSCSEPRFPHRRDQSGSSNTTSLSQTPSSLSGWTASLTSL